jgi:predicted metal-dependent hydrolase
MNECEQKEFNPSRADQDYPREYLHGIELFNSGKYWEAHEAWEEIWRVSQGDLKLFYQGLIQAAAALLHYDRHNLRGTNLCMNNALAKLEKLASPFMSLDLSRFTAQLRLFVADALENDRGQFSKNVNEPHPIIEINVQGGERRTTDDV